MARKLPPNAASPDDLDAAGIEATLARLPDAWTLIVDRRIGGADGPPVAWVLLHPDIGVALVDLAPAEPRHAADALRALLDAADPADRALAGVPIVALALGADASAAVGQQLAGAFAAAPPCRTTDPDWTDRVIGLLLTAEDAAMAPLGPPVPTQPEPSWQPRIGPEDAIAPPPRPQARRPAHRLPLAGAVAFLALAVLAVTYLLARGPIADTSSAVVAPMPVGAPVQRADTMPVSTPTGTEAAAPPPAAAPPQTAAAPPPPAPQPASPVSVSPPPQPVSAPPPENAVASPPPPQPTEAATPAAPPPAPAAIPRPAVARRPVRHERPRETARAHPAPSPARPGAPPAASPGGPPIDAGDLPPLAPPADMPEQQAANRPIDAPRPPLRRDGAPATGQPVMLLPPVGPPAAMPPPPLSGPGAGAFVGGPP